MLQLSVPKHLVWLIHGLYKDAKGVMRVGQEKTNSFKFGKGVRQGCLISPTAFIAVGELIMRTVLDVLGRERIGYRTGGRDIWNIRYADDSTLLAESKEDMQLMAEALKRISLEYGLQINSEKTNLMHIEGEGTITLDGKNLAEVRQVKFLGSQITDDGDSRTEVNKRLTTARITDMKMKKV